MTVPHPLERFIAECDTFADQLELDEMRAGLSTYSETVFHLMSFMVK